jgi:Putative prokaryotic signal transducing protein
MAQGASETDDNQKPQPNEKLVRVFDAEQESEVMVVQGLLQSQGIDTNLTSLEAQQDILPGVGGTVIMVREEDAAKARQVIEEYRQTPTDIEIDEGGEAADAGTTEDPAREG